MTTAPAITHGPEWARLSNLPGRLGGALAGAAGGAAVASVLELRTAATRAGEPLPWLSAWVAVLGVLALPTLLLGLGVGLGSWLLHPQAAPTPRRFWKWLDPDGPERRAALSAWLLVAPAALLGLFLASARLALGLLQSSASSAQVGLEIGVGYAVLASLCFGLGLALVSWLEPRLPRRMARPRVALLVGLGLPLGVIIYGIATGPVSGVGGLLGVLGVFRRQELELGAPAALTLIAATAYLGPGLFGRTSLLSAFAALLLLLGGLGHAATRGLEQRHVALAIERGAPLGRIALGPLRRMMDRDRDGWSPYFGGGDCDDHNPGIYPGADDLPGNGIDEDCSGRDAEPVVVTRARPKRDAEPARSRIPRDLNLVILSIDALRWDATRYAGSERNLTPNLDRLAERSIVFERAYALASYTGKSIPPTWIGKYGSETYRGWAHFNRVDSRDLLLQERLQRAGIRTLGVQGYWYLFRPGFGFERGWDVLDSKAARELGYVENDKSFCSDRIADRAIEVLKEEISSGRRFFLWSHFTDPHADYVLHEGFDFGRKSRDLYDSEVAFTDHHLGRIVDWIAHSPVADRTAIVIWADHGEAFGEHGMFRHGFELWEELVRVPFLVYVPGLEPRRIAARRSLIDLVPTVLDLMGVAAPSGQGDDFVSGQSLLNDLAGPAGQAPEERVVFIDMAAGPHNEERQAYIEQDLKLVTSQGRPLSLFDLARDPGEKRDLLDQRDLREQVVGRYRAFRRSLREIQVKPTP